MQNDGFSSLLGGFNVFSTNEGWFVGFFGPYVLFFSVWKLQKVIRAPESELQVGLSWLGALTQRVGGRKLFRLVYLAALQQFLVNMPLIKLRLCLPAFSASVCLYMFISF